MKIMNALVVSAMVLVVSSYSNAAGKSGAPGMNGVPFATLQSQVNDLETQMELLTESQQNLVAEMNERIAVLEGQVSQYQSMIDANMGDMDSLRQQLNAAMEELAMLQANVSSMETSLNNGCPSGMALRRVLEDGTVICESVSTGGDADGSYIRSSNSVSRTLYGSATTPGTVTVTATCPAGHEVTGGGYEVSPIPGVVVTRSRAYMNNSWSVTAISTAGRQVSVAAIAVCAGTTPPPALPTLYF